MATLWICTNPLTAEKHATQYNGRIGTAVSGDYEFFDHCRRHVHPDQIIEQGEYFAIPRLNGDPVTTAIIISVVTAALTYALMPKPEKPNGQGTQSSSPNNQASGQTNVARTGQGVPDVRGTVRSYPDLLQQAWYTYVGGRRFVREKFMISRGKITVSDVRDNDTLIADINGANYTDKEGVVLFGADFYPNRLTSLDDVSLLAPNNTSIDNVSRVLFLKRSASDPIQVGNDYGNYINVESTPNSNIPDLLGLYESDSFTIENTENMDVVGSAPGAGLNGTYTIDKNRRIVDFGTGVYEIPVIVSPDFPSPFPLYGYERGGSGNDATVSQGSGDGWTDWTLIKKEQQTSGTFPIYINLSFPQGLIKDNGDGRIVTLEIEARDSVTSATTPIAIAGSAPVVTASFSVLGQTRSPYGVTLTQFDVNSPDGNACEIRIRRTDNADSTSVSTTQIETIYQMISYEDGNIGQDYWAMDVDVKSDFTNRTQSSRKINCLATAWLHDPVSIQAGSFARGSSQEFQNWYNSVCTDMVLAFGENQSIIERRCNLDAMIDINDDMINRYGLDAYSLMNFSYTFDDIDLSLSQRIHTACNPSRIIAYRDGQQWTFSRNEAKPVSAIFNRRNISGGSEIKQTVKLKKEFDNDSIDLKFIDPETDKEAHIYLKVNNDAVLRGTFRANSLTPSGTTVTVSPSSVFGAYWFDSAGAVDIYSVNSLGAYELHSSAEVVFFDKYSAIIEFATSGEATAFASAFTSDDRISLYAAGLGTLSEEGKGVRPKEIDLVGCRNRLQARNRAEMELRELIYGRRTATVTTLGDGNNVNIGERVKAANPFDSSFVDGEVLANEGANLWRISERFEPEAGKTYYAHYTKPDGDVVGPVVAAATADPFVISAPLLSAYIADYESAQAGSLIVIGSEDDAYYYDWFVTGKKPNARGQVDLELATYDERIFEMD